MTIFNLPDLGEGLPEAEVHEWYVKEGDVVQADQPLVAMETAKAVVDVPAPQAGTIKKCYGNIGAIIRTGTPLIEFEAISQPSSQTVVGQLEEKSDITLGHVSTPQTTSTYPKATLAIRRYIQKLNLSIEDIYGTGEYGLITKADVDHYASQQTNSSFDANMGKIEPLKGVRRQMAIAMTESHQQIVPVTIFDEVEISHWQSPFDISVRLIQAICHAAKEEPALNAWFNGHERQLFNHVQLGLAIDSSDGLFVPVIPQADTQTSEQLRTLINTLKTGVSERSLSPQSFHGATITLSNFGKFAGKFASPIIVPPMVAILAVGRLCKNSQSTTLPLSLSFDHRAVTGGEATRFLGAVMEFLKQ
jgi:2-oxoisovalerate dehydrogenase E2 component (dihydrolipoyl transacylase)